ncbi:MAG: hypothetical protein AAF660_05060 [Pseudomonadota bacterium]
MPYNSEQRTENANLKTQVLSLLLLFGVAGPASAANLHCPSESSAPRVQTVDYTITRDRSPEHVKSVKDPETLKKTALALGTDRDTTVLRDDYVQSDLELPELDDDVTDPVARLLERRSLQKNQPESSTPEMKSALPGVDAEALRLFREKMYRTDI